MKTLYININGENIQSTEYIIVIGRPEDTIVNKFFFELGKEILKGVVAPGVSGIKKKDIVMDFKAHDEKSFNSIMDQWETLKLELLGDNPSGTRTINLPEDYITWLQNSSQPAYAEIAKSLYRRGGKVEVSLDKIYKNAIGIIVNNIEPEECKDCSQFVVNDNVVTDDSSIALAIQGRLSGIVFSPYENCEQSNSDSFQQRRNGVNQQHCVDSVSLVEFPIDCSFKIDKYLNENEAKRAGLPLFNDGLLLVENLTTHKLGYMNEQGKIIIPCSYCDAMPFSSGLAWVQQDKEYGKWFIIDSKGIVKNVVDKGYDIKYCNGSQLELGDNSFYSQRGDLLGINSSRSSYEYYSISEDGIEHSRNGHNKFIKNDNIIVETEDIVVSESNELYGIVNKVTGKIYVPCEYSKLLYLGKYYFYLEKDSRHKYIAIINI